MSDVLSTVPASAPKNGVSRRQLVKAGVWAAPAVAVAIAAPASAVSVSGATLSGTQQAGEAARTWNITLTVAGTTSPKSWSVQAITSGGPVAITGIPAAISAAGPSNGVATLTNWSSSATVFFRLTNGSTIVDTNAISVTSPAPTITLASGPTITSSTGSNRTVVCTTTVAHSSQTPTGTLTWKRVQANGTTTTGTSQAVVSGSFPTFTMTFTFDLSSNGGTKTATAVLSLPGATPVNVPSFSLG
ncbi:hypothetical protein ACSBPH_13020 [Microbacterium sp. F51-2R]|uniref:hypothetical protein n=1 Tax=Microbacterium sp. F51-2R TaxID=3445777 RepID=UPI003FA15C32